MNAVKDKVWFLREGLFAKYVVSLVGLVVFVLAVNGAMETWISYRGTKASLIDGMGEKAEATARRIEQSMSELERQISWVTRASANKLEHRRADYAQLLNQVPAVSQLSLLSAQGRELLRMSRQTVNDGSNADFSRDIRFTETAGPRHQLCAGLFPGRAALHVDRGVAFGFKPASRWPKSTCASSTTSSAMPRSAGPATPMWSMHGPGAGEFVEGPGGRQGPLTACRRSPPSRARAVGRAPTSPATRC